MPTSAPIFAASLSAAHGFLRSVRGTRAFRPGTRYALFSSSRGVAAITAPTWGRIGTACGFPAFGEGGFMSTKVWSRSPDLNWGPTDYESVALPTELLRLASDRKSTRLNSSHLGISYAVFCLKKKK